MRKAGLSTALALAAVIVGLYELWNVLSPVLSRLLTQEHQWADYVFLSTIVPMMAFPGAFLLFFGFRLLKDKTN